jgi:desulfoferrodoxin (superoxide reductase-like protein)
MMIAEKRDRKNRRRRKGLRGDAVTACVLMTILMLALFPASGGANSPQEVVLSYNQAQRTLEVRITHASKDPAAHYVKKVEIKRADKTITATEYQSQPGQATFAYVYPVEIGAEDVLEVKATCNIFGSKTEKLDMRKTPR